ncbi:unnamed protein product [Chironomus riparius]|uniref:Hemolymph juvenile hormone binding protein n=1 Tax=Chironomus riparius TaxID=315576 RepID=A0A9N9RSH9_9DIPT|nr:unnamed protein product [Chironomus riparius]
MRNFLFGSILLAISGAGFCALYPSSFPRCHYGEVECITKAFNQVLKLGKDGISEINLPSFEPLRVAKVDIIQDTTSNIAINLVLHDADIYGISNANIYRVVGFDKDISKSKFEVNALIPKLRITSKYIVDGKVLILPITGRGDSILNLDNADVKVKFKMEPFVKDGKTYTKIGKHKSLLSTSKLSLNLENLFNGNKALGDNMNNFINENWEIIFQELKPAISEALGKVLIDIVTNFFASVPYTDLFLE